MKHAVIVVVVGNLEKFFMRCSVPATAILIWRHTILVMHGVSKTRNRGIWRYYMINTV